MSGLADLQRRGYRKTAQRAVIVRVLEESGGHMTAAQIADAAEGGDSTLNRSTVYRTLETLVDLGMVKASRMGRSLLYEFIREGRHGHHLVCTGCGSTVHIEGAEIDQLIAAEAAQAGFSVTQAEVLVAGLCRACQRRALTNPRPGPSLP